MHPGHAAALSILVITKLAGPQQVTAGELVSTGSIGLASGQVYRGIALARETLVPNINVALEHSSGVYARTWLTRVQLAGLAYPSDESTWQTLLDVGYLWQLQSHWTISAAHRWYHYSENTRGSDRDYREWSASLDYGAYLTLNYAYTNDLWGRDLRQDVTTLSGRWPFTQRLVGEAAVGWVSQHGQRGDSYSFLRLNAGCVIRDWSFQLQFHTTHNVDGYYRKSRIGNQWIAQMDWHW